ncbi:hypothetical protein HPP92_019855 [Vanilla planifolia]|uniref:U-box domain-containing protein n=1 Tax=Vanilla planifolia TaxID=51239 RepID=A0A835Q7N8_VANPL|nr:hypothetical protein HPP92_019855 [Vanilla planifolia]
MALKSLKHKYKLPFLRPPKRPAELSIPSDFLCPISLDLMKDPVTIPTGITYDRKSIEYWLDAGNRTCPVTNQSLLVATADDLIPNHSIRRVIQDWCVAHRSDGVERIPTPKTPVTTPQVLKTLSEISAACRRGDGVRCAELVAVLRIWAEENERNKRCILSNNAAGVLAAAFLCFPSENFLTSFAEMWNPDSDELSLLELCSPESLNSIVSILRNGSVEGRLNTVMVVKDLLAVACTRETLAAAMIARTGGLVEEVAKLIIYPISSQATKASLVAAHHLAASQATKLAGMGLVSVLVEIMVDAEKSICEKAMAVLERILESEAGRERAAAHALAVPVLVKKMFRVSDLVTEMAVSAIWKLCRSDRDGGGEKRRGEECAVEALRVGAFQKLLMLLQVGCSENTKEKASELLKLLNGYRASGECVESVDLKGLKRSF